MPYKYGTYGEIGETIAHLNVVADTIPVYFGTAPANLVRGYKDADLVNKPIKIRSMADAQAKLGYSPDWDRFTLCEAMAAHYDNTNGAVGPVYMFNVLDPDTHRVEMPTTTSVTLVNNKAEIKGSDMILDTLKIARPRRYRPSARPVHRVARQGYRQRRQELRLRESL